MARHFILRVMTDEDFNLHLSQPLNHNLSVYNMRKTEKRRTRRRRHTKRKKTGGGVSMYSYSDKVSNVPFYVNNPDNVFGFGIKPVHSVFRVYTPDDTQEFDPYTIFDKVKMNKRWSIGADK